MNQTSDVEAVKLLKMTRQKHQTLLNTQNQELKTQTDLEKKNRCIQKALSRQEQVLIRAKPTEPSGKPPLRLSVPKDLKYEYKPMPSLTQTCANIRRSINSFAPEEITVDPQQNTFMGSRKSLLGGASSATARTNFSIKIPSTTKHKSLAESRRKSLNNPRQTKGFAKIEQVPNSDLEVNDPSHFNLTQQLKRNTRQRKRVLSPKAALRNTKKQPTADKNVMNGEK